MLLIAGVFYDEENAPAVLRDIAEVLPLKHLVDGLSGAIVHGEGVGAPRRRAARARPSGRGAAWCSRSAASPGRRARPTSSSSPSRHQGAWLVAWLRQAASCLAWRLADVHHRRGLFCAQHSRMSFLFDRTLISETPERPFRQQKRARLDREILLPVVVPSLPSGEWQFPPRRFCSTTDLERPICPCKQAPRRRDLLALPPNGARDALPLLPYAKKCLCVFVALTFREVAIGLRGLDLSLPVAPCSIDRLVMIFLLCGHAALKRKEVQTAQQKLVGWIDASIR